MHNSSSKSKSLFYILEFLKCLVVARKNYQRQQRKPYEGNGAGPYVAQGEAVERAVDID